MVYQNNNELFAGTSYVIKPTKLLKKPIYVIKENVFEKGRNLLHNYVSPRTLMGITTVTRHHFL